MKVWGYQKTVQIFASNFAAPPLLWGGLRTHDSTSKVFERRNRRFFVFHPNKIAKQNTQQISDHDHEFMTCHMSFCVKTFVSLESHFSWISRSMVVEMDSYIVWICFWLFFSFLNKTKAETTSSWKTWITLKGMSTHLSHFHSKRDFANKNSCPPVKQDIKLLSFRTAMSCERRSVVTKLMKNGT